MRTSAACRSASTVRNATFGNLHSFRCVSNETLGADFDRGSTVFYAPDHLGGLIHQVEGHPAFARCRIGVTMHTISPAAFEARGLQFHHPAAEWPPGLPPTARSIPSGFLLFSSGRCSSWFHRKKL